VSERKPLMVDVETHEKVMELVGRYKLGVKEIVSYLVNLAIKYRLLESDWKKYILEDSLEKYKLELEQEAKIDLEKQKFRERMRFKYLMVKSYLQLLNLKERKTFIEDVMVDIKDPAFLDKLGEMEVVIVNGKRKLTRFSDGKPIFNVSEDRVLECEVGYHIKGSLCDCRKWRECPIRMDEYAEWKAKRSVIVP